MIVHRSTNPDVQSQTIIARTDRAASRRSTFRPNAEPGSLHAYQAPCVSSPRCCSPVLSVSRGGSLSGPKLRGNSSPMVLTMNLPSFVNMNIGVSSSRNSRRNWRHMPQGEQKSSMSVATPTALKLLHAQHRFRPGRQRSRHWHRL
jgi:hypothetical protein